MTKQEYASIQEIADIPCYHEESAQCDSLLKTHDTRYTGETFERESLDETNQLLSDPSYEVKGAILDTDCNKDVYRIIFWKLRDDKK